LFCFFLGVVTISLVLTSACRTPISLTPTPLPPHPSRLLDSLPTVLSVSPANSNTSENLTNFSLSPLYSSISGVPSALLTDARIESNKAVVSFPDRIRFSLKGSSPVPVKYVWLEYSTNSHAVANASTRIKIDFQQSVAMLVSWDWNIENGASLPPGTLVRWQWILTDVNERSLTVPGNSVVFLDTRYSWQIRNMPEMDIYWHVKNENLIFTLTNALQSHLARLELNVTIPPERRPKVFVYDTSEELRGAVPHSPDWAGAMAFPDYNVILTAINDTNLDWALDALPHEVAHLLIGEAVFGPFGDIPLWLNEGLAQYTEMPIATYLQASLAEAIRSNDFIPIRNLSDRFPADQASANLAYAESASLVNYMIQNYGWETMRSLLAVFKEGATYDKALLQVYQLDVNGLDAAWRASLKK